MGYFVGNPIDDDEYTIKVKRDKMKELLKQEQEAKIEYELAQSRTKKAIHDEEMALMELQLIEKSKVNQLEGSKKYLSKTPIYCTI